MSARCKRGHPLEGARADVQVTPQGKRHCRRCRREYDRDRYEHEADHRRAAARARYATTHELRG